MYVVRALAAYQSKPASQVRFIGDQNPFRESSAGVQFFGVSALNPELYTVQRGEILSCYHLSRSLFRRSRRHPLRHQCFGLREC